MTTTRVWADATTTVMATLAAEFGIPVVAVVPDPRPAEFLLVRRSGGGNNRVLDRARMTVEVWSGEPGGSTQPVEDLAGDVRETLALMPATTPGVTRVDEDGLTFYPDPTSGTPRAIITVTAWLKPESWTVAPLPDLLAQVQALQQQIQALQQQIQALTVIDGGTPQPQE